MFFRLLYIHGITKQLSTKIVLIDGTELSKLMIEYDIGVTTQNTYAIKKLDLDFFSYDND